LILWPGVGILAIRTARYGPDFSFQAGTHSSFIQWLTAERRRSRAMGCPTTALALEERLQRGVAFKVDGNYEEAERELKAVLREDPNHPVAHRELGLVYCFTGMFDESVEELKRAVDLDPSDLKARNDLALTYTMIGMMDEARAEFELVLSVDPTNSVALRNMQYFEN
jgi:Tfp pilus assembly protein PilF